jgi:hypothetical protein
MLPSVNNKEEINESKEGSSGRKEESGYQESQRDIREQFTREKEEHEPQEVLQEEMHQRAKSPSESTMQSGLQNNP